MRIKIHSQYRFTFVTLTEVQKDILFVSGMLTEKLYSVLCLEKHTQYLWNNITPGSSEAKRKSTGRSRIRGEINIQWIECCRDGIFSKANGEFSIALVPSTKSLWDFWVGFWNIKNKPCGKHKFMMLTRFVVQDKLRRGTPHFWFSKRTLFSKSIMLLLGYKQTTLWPHD